MASDLGDHKGREPGNASFDLASEIRRLIREIDADHYSEEELSRAEAEKYDEMQSESPGLSATIYSLKRNLEDASAESLIAIRLLHELVRLRHSELLNHLAHMEQNLQDEINLMERRIRGDIAMLRTEREGRARTDLENEIDEDPDSEPMDFRR
ncbi:MAG: hypothetical protein ACOC9Y_03380 [Chloroflexota bacterium]